MTDNEIIKALEDKTHKAEYSWVDGSYCDVEVSLLKNALDLINRQQEEIADERAKIEICAETISRQDAEIKRLTTLAKLGNMRADDYRAMRDKCKTARTEAIKEFAERLKKPNRWREEDIYYIDTLVEEMVGEE